MPELSDAIKDLIKKARIVSFETWHGSHPPEAIALFQAADDAGLYLTDVDYQTLTVLAPKSVALMAIAQQFRDQAADIVDEAREQVLETFPELTQPGGGLYPAARAEACWRDFWHFLRCISYGIAGNHPDYLSQVGLHHMEQLYQELRVPLKAMTLGLEGVKAASLRRVAPEMQATITPYFDHLISYLQYFEED
jgi:hypothetical protein